MTELEILILMAGRAYRVCLRSDCARFYVRCDDDNDDDDGDISCNNQVADEDFRTEHMQAERMNWEVCKKGSSDVVRGSEVQIRCLSMGSRR